MESLAMVKGPRQLAAENMVLGHRVTVLRRKHPGRIRLSRLDRIFPTWLYPSVLDTIFGRPGLKRSQHHKGGVTFEVGIILAGLEEEISNRPQPETIHSPLLDWYRN